jgi:signal transduction histidine kinase
MKLSSQKINLREIVNLAIETIRPVAKRKEIEIVSEIDDNIPLCLSMDREKILQIFNNLFSNAVKFTESGLITLKMALSSEPAKESILFSVKDSGIGIPEKHLDKIFDKFYQVDDSSTRPYGGTGLGLAIAKSFVELHGGEIWLESIVDQGTEVFFTIPIQE